MLLLFEASKSYFFHWPHIPTELTYDLMLRAVPNPFPSVHSLPSAHHIFKTPLEALAACSCLVPCCNISQHAHLGFWYIKTLSHWLLLFFILRSLCTLLFVYLSPIRRNSLSRGRRGTGRGCPEQLRVPHAWKCSRPWAAWAGAHGRGLELDRLPGPFQPKAFCDSLNLFQVTSCAARLPFHLYSTLLKPAFLQQRCSRVLRWYH